MTDIALVDTNVLLLVLIGSISPAEIRKHKRLSQFDVAHYEHVLEYLGLFDDIIVTPHILTETSNLSRHSQFRDSSATRIASAFRQLLKDYAEDLTASAPSAERREFAALGLTDCVILDLLDQSTDETTITLVSSDRDLVSRARSLGHSVYDVLAEFA
ncbi:MAG: hypothetical protein P4L98_09440 [Ancalomicrobiaceae bacterium]|nr:hypothetical protein [Ancalomicrobiaceae bacterium]